MAHRLRQPLPGAQPRLRFEMPPEQDDETTPETETGTRFGDPGPRMSSQHPLYVGFMGTVGVGVLVAVAVERGTPLADVLHAQAADVREASRRELIETAARKEVFMMVPVVFLVLPVTVLFAFFPGVIGLSLTIP